MDPPVVPADRLDGWKRVERTTERPFAAGLVSVTAGTARYERVDRAEPRPFFFASRLRIRPETPPNAALTRVVEDRARAGFRDRLADRDIEAVERRGKREISIDEPTASRATLWTFRGTCRLDGVADVDGGGVDGVGGDEERSRNDREGEHRGEHATVPVEALLAVWEAGEYLLAGGAYPLTGEPERARRGLLRLVRGTRSV